MLAAVIATLFTHHIISYQWIILGGVVGALAGVFTAYRTAMTKMPETIALLHGFGGLASLLVDWSAYHTHPTTDPVVTISIYLSVLIGGLTFTGSCVAWGKLSEVLPGKAIIFPGLRFLNIGILIALLVGGAIFITNPLESYNIFLGIMVLSFLFGILMIIPIGGADMPVVISVLNSYSGLVACTTGFVINNIVLIVVGALVGANGVIILF